MTSDYSDRLLAGEKFEEHDSLRFGWTLGAGLEANLDKHWFARGEYRYTDLGKSTEVFFAEEPLDTITADVDLKTQRLSVGLGYRF